MRVPSPSLAETVENVAPPRMNRRQAAKVRTRLKVLDAARTTYLGREYSGRHDRRPSPGRARKTEI